MLFKPEINWYVVFIQIPQHREISRGEKNLHKCLLPVSARELLIEGKMTAAADKLDPILARWTYAHYFQFFRDKDVKNIIVKCTLCAKPKDLSTSWNSTSNLTKHQERCDTNIKLVTKRKQTKDESGDAWTVILELREMRRVVAEYVVEDMLPLSTVDSHLL